MKGLILICVCIYLVFTASKSIAIELIKIKDIPTDSAPKAVEISPDGKYACVVNLEGSSIWLVDTDTFQVFKKVEFFKTSGIGWDYRKDRPIKSVREKPVECDFTESGRYIWVSLHNDSSVVIYDNMEEQFESKNPAEYKKAKIIELTDDSSSQRIIKLRRIVVGKTPKVVKASPDGKYIYVSNWHSSSISVIDAKTFTKIKDVKVGSGQQSLIPRGIGFSTDSKIAYVANMGGGSISVIDVQSGHNNIREFPASRNPRHIVITKGNKYLYLSDNIEGKVKKVDLTDYRVVGEIKVGKLPRTICLDPNEDYLFTAVYGSNILSIIDTKTMEAILTSKMYKPMGVSVSPNGKQVWVKSYQGNYVSVFEIN